MLKFISWTVLLLSLWLATPTLAADAPATQEAPKADPAKPADLGKPAEPDANEIALRGDKDLAVRFATLAQEWLRQKVVLPPHFRQSAALLMTAMQLDPEEPRYPRMLYEAMLQMRDSEGAYNALKAYRKLVPQDQVAMVAYIDLHTRRMENADDRIAELERLLDLEQVPSEVRSHCALRLSQMAREKGQSDREQAMLAQAMRLNPLSLEALRIKLEQQSDEGTAAERMLTMLQMLKSNPAQPAVTYRLARECADAGLPDESLRFYMMTSELAGGLGTSMGREFAVGYAAELFIMNQPQVLASVKFIAEQLLKADPGDVEALQLRWLAERAGDEKEAAAKTPPLIANAALNRLYVARQQLGETGPGATTRPVDSAEAVVIPDLSEDIKKLGEEKYAPLATPYAQAVADLAWYLVYADNKPDEAARLLPALKSLLGDTNPLAVRIEGWIAMKKNQLDQAKIKLQAVAEDDILARMGTLILASADSAQKDKAMASARKLLMENPSGLLAAVLMDGLKPLNVKLVPREDAPALQQLIKEFPSDWLNIVKAPQTFYVLKADMVDGKVRFGFGQPMMAKITIKNLSEKYPITIGPEGTIKSDLWFDAQFRGLVQTTLTGAAYDRIAGPLVLRPGQSVTQLVRLDQGQLAQLLTGTPQPVLTFYGQVRTNPRGEGGSAPCGYQVPFTTITEREGWALTEQARRQLHGQIASGTPAEKLRGIELIAAIIEQYKPQAQANDQAKALVLGFTEVLDKSQTDPSNAVAIWGSFLTAVQSPERRSTIMMKFLTDPARERRLLALLMGNGLPPEQQIPLLKKVIDTDKDEAVVLFANAMAEIAEVAIEGRKNAPATAPVEPLRPAPEPGVLRP